MFTNESSILECPMPPLFIERPTNWKFNKTEIAPNCPRCASSNTKFCYYNNYSFSQPRYFCKGCRRYWTKGGSLRNVPAGGGCRKSRRSRAARQEAFTNCPVPSGGLTDVRSSNTSENGTEIDLAAVFAKYVNPNVDHEEYSSPGASSESSENVPASSSDIDSQNPVDWINGLEGQMIPQISMNDVNVQDFVYQNSDALEMQSIIGDDLTTEDILWSNETNMPNFGSQLHLQEFGLFAPEDQLRVSGTLTADNWGSFDISAYDFF